MKYKYDRYADAIYVYLSSGKYSYGDDKDEDRRIDYSSDNRPIGVELLSVSKGVNLDGLPEVDEIESILKNEGITTYTMSHCTYSGFYGTSSIMFNVQLIHLGDEEQKQPNEIFKQEVTA
jgi:uncharacterized protein YuzE